jgi:ankyrin repeat protein
LLRFLLAYLHLDSIIHKTTHKAIILALDNLLKGSNALNRAYGEAIRRIKEQDQEHAKQALRVLSWITCAERPLTSIELQYALAIEAGELELGGDNFQDIEEIVSLCAGLVTIDEEGDVVRLVHYTTQEYFEESQSSLFPDAQKDIAVACITYLSFNAFESGFCPKAKLEERLRLHPFYSYAAQNWGYHARAASMEVEQLTLNFLKSEQKILAAGQALIASLPGYSERVPGHLTAAHLAVYFDLTEAILALFQDGYHMDSKDNYGQTPLSWAAENGHEAVVIMLLEMSAEIDSKDNCGQTPLLWAIRNGHEKVVSRLFERGAEIESKDKDGCTLLLWAARKGHESEVRLLLGMGAEIESKDRNGLTPLLWAARNGHEMAVTLLLERGAAFDSRDNDGKTPFSWAVENGHEAVVRLLLEKGAEFDSKDNYGRTPLSWAARKGYEVLVRLLLEKGANLESKDNKGLTPLSWAERKRHNAVERLILENGAKT